MVLCIFKITYRQYLLAEIAQVYVNFNNVVPNFVCTYSLFMQTDMF